MTLGDLEMPTTLADAARLRQYGLVFSQELAARLAELHSLHCRPDVSPNPLTLADGRLTLNADCLIATLPGHPFHEMWQAADKSVLNSQVEVVPWQPE